MTVKNKLKILDRKIKQNKADYDFYRTKCRDLCFKFWLFR